MTGLELEERAMELGSYLSAFSLQLTHNLPKDENLVYVVTDHLYSVIGLGDMSSITAPSGLRIPQGDLEAFIESKRVESNTLGFIPITKGASKLINKYEMVPVLEGLPVSDQGHSAIVFN